MEIVPAGYESRRTMAAFSSECNRCGEQGWQGRNGGADLRPAPRAPDRNPRPRAPPSHGYLAPLARAGPAGYPDNYRGVTRVTYRVTVAANALSSI